jgi:hypothetical protein
MYDRWEIALFLVGLYRRSAFEVHACFHATSWVTIAHFRR